MKITERETYEGLVRIEQREASSSDRNIQNANESERALCGQLMLVSTVLLTATVVVVGNQDALTALTTCARILVAISFLLTLVSIAFGIKYYFDNIRFYTDWGKLHHENYETFRDGLLDMGEVKVEEMNKKARAMKERAEDKYLRYQIQSLALTAISYVWLLAIVLFTTPKL